MATFIEQFKKFPQAIRTKIGSPETKRKISELERNFQVDDLLTVVVRVLVNDLKGHDFDIALEERGADENKIELLKSDLQAKFVKPYLAMLGQAHRSLSTFEAGDLIDSYKKFLQHPEVQQVLEKVEEDSNRELKLFK